MKKIFSGKQALVIGGTGGIGRFISRGLAECGAELTVIGSSAEKMKRTSQEIKKIGGVINENILTLEAGSAVDNVLSICRYADILVCAYGPFKRTALSETTVEDWHSLVTLNLILPGSLVSSYLGGMMKKKWGRILLFGGTNTDFIRGWTTTAPYAAAKTALGPLAKSVAKNASAFGVTCNVLCPGLTDTEYMDNTAKKYNRENSPAGVALTPQEVAAFALDILKNPSINGAIVPIDKGVEVHAV